jgi:Uma2 family endonuclease
MASMAAIPLEEEIYYPESDGEPMAETQLHMKEMVYLVEALEERFQDTPDVFVAANLFFYYGKGRRDAVVAPDLFVVRGIPKGLRRKYLLWEEEEKVPCFVAELTSASTRREDLVSKKELYERLGVEEYILFDPYDEYLEPPFQGYRLVGGRYRRMEPEPDGSLVSRTLGVILKVEDGRLRILDAETGVPLLRNEEKTERLRALEAEIARLRGGK